jgi:Uri superfamily endonuclease
VLIIQRHFKQHRAKRWAYYSLNVPVEIAVALHPATMEEKVLEYIRKHGSLSRIKCRALLGLSDIQTKYFLQKMNKARQLRLVGRGRGAKYVLP